MKRKSGKFCAIGDTTLTSTTTLENCPCSMRDYECDFTYVRNSSGQCSPNPNISPPKLDDKCKSGQWTGYRKIPGSVCKGGLQLQGLDTRECVKYKEGGGLNIDDGASGPVIGVSLVFGIFVVTAISLGGVYYKRLPALRLPRVFRQVGYSTIGTGDAEGSHDSEGNLGSPLANMGRSAVHEDEEEDESAALTPKQSLI